MSVSRVVRARPSSSSAGMISISGDESTLTLMPALLRLGVGGGVAARVGRIGGGGGVGRCGGAAVGIVGPALTSIGTASGSGGGMLRNCEDRLVRSAVVVRGGTGSVAVLRAA